MKLPSDYTEQQNALIEEAQAAYNKSFAKMQAIQEDALSNLLTLAGKALDLAVKYGDTAYADAVRVSQDGITDFIKAGFKGASLH